MEAQEKIKMAEENIRQAIADYRRHTELTEVLDNVSDCFIKRLARDNYYAKQELRELFRKSPAWDEKLDAIVINGTRTHEPDCSRVNFLAHCIFEGVMRGADMDLYSTIHNALQFFSNPAKRDDERVIEAIKTLAPKAYAPGKKPTRVLKALCDALNINNETCERFSYLYAQLADEITSHKIDFKLFVSLNPAHFITMSNPKEDTRGNTLTSCHSFNSTEYTYNNGCSGYARDKYTFIVFTVVDPTKAETLNNRKNRRQIFCYKPGNGVLLQSRLYNDAGGTSREQAESKVYRDLVQREISMLEEQPNLWQTFRYCGNEKIRFSTGSGFGGYPDWEYSDFNAKVSIRADHADDYRAFSIGTWGLCISCGEETEEGLYCSDCRNDGERCACCDGSFDLDELFPVSNGGEMIYVCERCRDENYSYCDCCNEYFSNYDMIETADGGYVCPNCLTDYYSRCQCCYEWVRDRDIYNAINSQGYEVGVCESCINEHYVRCEDCQDAMVHEDDVQTVYDQQGNELHVGPCCLSHYEECRSCGRLVEAGSLSNGICSDCTEV